MGYACVVPKMEMGRRSQIKKSRDGLRGRSEEWAFVTELLGTHGLPVWLFRGAKMNTCDNLHGGNGRHEAKTSMYGLRP